MQQYSYDTYCYMRSCIEVLTLGFATLNGSTALVAIAWPSAWSWNKAAEQLDMRLACACWISVCTPFVYANPRRAHPIILYTGQHRPMHHGSCSKRCQHSANVCFQRRQKTAKAGHAVALRLYLILRGWRGTAGIEPATSRSFDVTRSGNHTTRPCSQG